MSDSENDSDIGFDVRPFRPRYRDDTDVKYIPFKK